MNDFITSFKKQNIHYIIQNGNKRLSKIMKSFFL